jgi:fatty acyl-ACP thioesterase A
MAKGIYQFKVRTYECGSDGYATMPSICNYLQEAASINAGELGFSKSNFDDSGENVSWVLTRLIVKMTDYPKWEDEITVETFPRGGRKIVAWRDFEIKNSSGETIGAASSEWMLIDLASRKVVAVPSAVLECIDPDSAPVLGENPFSKLRFPDGDATEPLTFTAQKSHIDLNGHVNNVHYLEWMLEACESFRPHEMEVIFRGETMAGDKVLVTAAEAGESTLLRVFAPDGKDHIIARTMVRRTGI